MKESRLVEPPTGLIIEVRSQSARIRPSDKFSKPTSPDFLRATLTSTEYIRTLAAHCAMLSYLLVRQSKEERRGKKRHYHNLH